tara:strand:- start:1978 stop:3036 length:1059 start_codon:yes stop_codon:yes gene_type:complete
MNLNKFQIGLFAFNASSGVTLTKKKNFWKADIDKIIKLAKKSDNYGIDFLLPIARWSDWRGDTRPHKKTFETFSLMSYLAGITKKIYLFSTVHTSFVNPVLAARMTTTLSQISKGRFGVNIVCGWNKNEYEMFDVNLKISSKSRYIFGREWLKIYNSLLDKKKDTFTFKGNYISTRNAQCFPKLYSLKKFTKISAGFSKSGREFAQKNFDILLTMFGNLNSLKENIKNIKKKSKNLKVIVPLHIVCKKTTKEALQFYNDYSHKNQDKKAVSNFIRNLEWSKKNKLASFLNQVKQQVAGSTGIYTIKGDKKKVIEDIKTIKRSGVDGIAITFFDYEKELDYFLKNIFPKIKNL